MSGSTSLVLKSAIALFAAVAALAALNMIWSWERLNKTKRLLVEAFSERRTIDVRFPGARFAGGRWEHPGPTNAPPALLEAELAIAKALANDGSNPQWLQAAAQAKLYRWDYAGALESLRRARAARPENASLSADVALAHFERAEKEHRGADYSFAAEAFSKAIDRSPRNSELRFNRAVVYERLFLYSQSAADWKEAIQLEPDGGWATEARARLAGVEAKTAGGHDLITPRAYLAMRPSGLDSELALRAATESWLQIVSGQDESGRAEAMKALRVLAMDLGKQRNDRWLLELLPSLYLPLGRHAVASLAQAIHANATGHGSEAGRFGREAEALFEKIPNRAGALYSSFEVNYAQQRALQRGDCAVANAKLSRAIPREFVWLNVQVWTERGVCEYYSGNPGASWAGYSTAVQLAKEAGYREAAIRPLAYQNDFRADLGDANGAWQASLTGLAEVWSRPHDRLSPYHFYSRIFTLANRAGDWSAALAAKREAIGALASLGNPSLLALNHYQAANLALSAGNQNAAEEEFRQAQTLFQSLPTDRQIQAYLFYCELGRAEAEMRAGNIGEAKAGLGQIATQLNSVNDARIRLRYQDLLGRLSLQLSDLANARTAFQAARALVVGDRQSLRDARQLALWTNTNRDFYHSLVDLSLREQPAGNEAWAAWREYLGRPIPPEVSPSISFVVLPDRVIAWLQEGAGLTMRNLPASASELALLANDFRRSCADPRTPLPELRAAGKRLYRLLLEPFADRIHGRVWIEPDGFLAGVPWEALVTPDGRWAGDTATFVVALEGIRRVEEPAVGAGLHLLAVAASNGSSELQENLPPLPGAVREARAVGAMFRDPVVLAGNDAVFEKVRQAAPQAEVFHFAGHHGTSGLLLSETPGQPAVLDLSFFGAPGHAQCRLAVLSACQTSAVSDDEWDPDTLIRTLHRYGIPVVVASRWGVDSEVTASLMKNFYRSLLGGGKVDAALDEASRTIRQQPAQSHPYFWAAFASFQ